MENYLTINVVTETKREIKIEKIKNTDICAFWDEYDIITNGKNKKETVFGITAKDNLLRVQELEPINLRIKDEKLYNKFGFICGIKKEDLNSLFSGKKHITEVITQIDEEKYKSNDYELIIWNSGSHKILDLSRNFISIPLYFGYMDGNFDNENFYIDKLLEFLKNDKNVCDRENIEIKNIPYYNTTEERTESIEFKYLLPTDIYNKLMEKKLNSFDNENYIVRNIMNVKSCAKETGRYYL